MAGVEQSLADAQKAQSTPSGGGEASSSQNLKAGSNPEGRTVTIDESQVEEVFPEVGDHTTDIDRSKLRPVKGRAPTPIPSEEEWNIMQKEIQQLATGGAGEQKQQYGGQQREKPQQEPAEQMPQTCLWATSKTSGQKQ
ncbi:hypothetical protein BIW11_07190 [Tropilaelaps mercedesae]|uniref:Uncharacterized protein n=1 Tax=Tropilaelaps mercedesae TaxID=418985 RepID=A0A1V9XUX0_9ACAR|nr:hypothetical protein BIW11_07190 [Tropilaelaps mercedesae]